MKRGKQADSQRRNQTGGVRRQRRWRMSLSGASVEVMTTESGDDCRTSSMELTPLTGASKRGDVLICKLYLNNLVYFKKKSDAFHPSALRKASSPVLPLVENSHPSTEDGRCSMSRHFIVGVFAGHALLRQPAAPSTFPKGRVEMGGGQEQGGAFFHLTFHCPLTSA